MEDKVTKHESFGQLVINKFSGTSGEFYGSSIQYNGGVSLSICESECVRGLNYDRYYPGKELIRVEMSYTQFAEAITAGMNTTGTPCTIKRHNGNKIEGIPSDNKRVQIDKEFDTYMKKLTNNLSKLTKDTKELLNSKKPINKSERAAILSSLAMLEQGLESNVPFIKEMFTEQMDKTVVEAKGEIEGFHESKIRNLGLEAATALGITKPIMIGEKSNLENMT